jgi:hypothetical protein
MPAFFTFSMHVIISRLSCASYLKKLFYILFYLWYLPFTLFVFFKSAVNRSVINFFKNDLVKLGTTHMTSWQMPYGRGSVGVPAGEK